MVGWVGVGALVWVGDAVGLDMENMCRSPSKGLLPFTEDKEGLVAEWCLEGGSAYRNMVIPYSLGGSITACCSCGDFNIYLLCHLSQRWDRR